MRFTLSRPAHALHARPDGSPLRKILASLLLLTALLLVSTARSAEEPAGVETLRVMTIGNSFANNGVAYLPALAEAAGRKVILFRANLGGHSMQAHVGYLKAFEADPGDPAGHPYKKQLDPKTGQKRDFSLVEALEAEPWDLVTIQQVSTLSFKPESYEPYAGILIAAIRKHAPQARIAIHETWAYREDHRLFGKGDLTPETMHTGLQAAYRKLAADYGLPIIPVGSALHTARELERWRFVPDPAFRPAQAPVGALPMEKSELFKGARWAKSKKTGKDVLTVDAKHLKPAGSYLAGAVFLYTLFPDVTASPFCPPELQPADADALQKIARETVAAAGAGLR